jgi:hypothetical protein
MFMSSEFVEYTGSVMVPTLQDVVRMRRGMPVVKMLNGYLYVRRCGGIAGGYSEEALQKLAAIAKEE